jgi:hypothetical protein
VGPRRSRARHSSDEARGGGSAGLRWRGGVTGAGWRAEEQETDLAKELRLAGRPSHEERRQRCGRWRWAASVGQ